MEIIYKKKREEITLPFVFGVRYFILRAVAGSVLSSPAAADFVVRKLCGLNVLTRPRTRWSRESEQEA